MTPYERHLYKTEIEKLRQDNARLRTLLQMWQQAAKLDEDARKEARRGANEPQQRQTGRA